MIGSSLMHGRYQKNNAFYDTPTYHVANQPIVIWKIADVRCCVRLLFGFHRLFRFTSGGRLNKKDGLTRYGDSHVKDKTS